MQVIYSDNRKAQYGQWMALRRNPSKAQIRDAKKLLRIGLRKTNLLHKKNGYIAEEIVWIVHPRFEYIDQRTGQTKIVGTVGWKRWYRKPFYAV